MSIRHWFRLSSRYATSEREQLELAVEAGRAQPERAAREGAAPEQVELERLQALLEAQAELEKANITSTAI